MPTAVRCAVQEEEKNKIQNDLRILTERLSRINESLARKVRPRAHVPPKLLILPLGSVHVSRELPGELVARR